MEAISIEIRQMIESGSRKVHDASLSKSDIECSHAFRHCYCSKSHRIRRHHPHLILVHLNKIEAATPRSRIRKRLKRPHPIGLHGKNDRVQIAINRSLEVCPNQLHGFQIELEATYEVDEQRVEIGEQWLETQPAPCRHAASETLTS